MKHCLTEELVARYVEGKTTPFEDREVAAHLERCPECRALTDALSLVCDLDAAGALQDQSAPLVIRCVWNGYALRHWRKKQTTYAAETVSMVPLQHYLSAYAENEIYPPIYAHVVKGELRLRFQPLFPIAVEIEFDNDIQAYEVPLDGELRFELPFPSSFEVLGVSAVGEAEESLIFSCRLIPEK